VDQIDMPVPCQIQYHAGSWLTASAVVGILMCADPVIVDGRTAANLRQHGLEQVQCYMATGHVRLVGDDEDEEVGLLQEVDTVKVVHQSQFFEGARRARPTVALDDLVENAVPVEEYSAAGPHIATAMPWRAER
jgi:hypothetical protein